MKKNIFGRKFKRDTNERKALFKNLISSLILDGEIKTTEEKAKAIKGDVDKLITKVKKNGEIARQLVGSYIFPYALDKLINDIAPRFANRNGGYTRIIRIGKRFGDNATVVLMEWTEEAKGLSLTADRLPRTEKAARKTKTKSAKSFSSLNERRQSNSKVKSKAKPSRRSVASQSGKRSSVKSKAKKK